MSIRAEVDPPACWVGSAVHVAAPDPDTDSSQGGPTPVSNPGFTRPFDTGGGTAPDGAVDGVVDGGGVPTGGVDEDGAGGADEEGAGGLLDGSVRPMRSASSAAFSAGTSARIVLVDLAAER